MRKTDVPSSEPSKKPALVQFGHDLWNKLTGQYEYAKQPKVERMAVAERRNILKQSTKERRNIFSLQSINTYTAGERLSPQETAQKVQNIFGNVESVKIPRSNGNIEVATRRSDGLFYFAGKNTPCYLDKNEMVSKNIETVESRVMVVQKKTQKRVNELLPKDISQKNAIAGVAFYQKNLSNQNNAPNQAPKSDISPQVPVNPSDASGKTEGAQNETLKTKEGIGFVGDSHFNFLTGNLGYSPYGRSKKIPGESTVAIPTVMSGGNMGEKGYSISQLITSPLGQEYLQGKKDIVVCLGTNDATMFRADQMVLNMTKIVSSIRAINPAGKIIVVTPPRNRSPLVNAKIAEYQEMLLAREGSLGIKVAPFYTYSQEQRLGLSDADHLNTAGYQAMKQYINSYIS